MHYEIKADTEREGVDLEEENNRLVDMLKVSCG